VRQNFYWWPIHPIGYVTTGLNGGIWFLAFLGWLIKTRVLKYAGGEGYKKLIPFFFGLFAGDYAAAGFWAIVGAFVGAMRFNVLRLESLSF
jgi:hypothetical protein